MQFTAENQEKYKWFKAMHSERKLITGLTKIEKLSLFMMK
jgi:hypothetical protein